jgi:hypothetical protein
MTARDTHGNGVTGAAGAEALRSEIARTRAELGETVEALAAKADVKARVRERVDEAKANAREITHDLPGNARIWAVRLGRAVRDRPAPFAAALGAFVLVVALARWRRNR